MLVLRQPGDSLHVQDTAMRQLIDDRLELIAAEFEPESSNVVLVAQAEDGDTDITARLGFSIFENRYDGKRFGDAGFTPSFEVLEQHATCLEMVFVLCDDGSGAIVFIPNDVLLDARLPALRERYAIRAQET